VLPSIGPTATLHPRRASSRQARSRSRPPAAASRARSGLRGPAGGRAGKACGSTTGTAGPERSALARQQPVLVGASRLSVAASRLRDRPDSAAAPARRACSRTTGDPWRPPRRFKRAGAHPRSACARRATPASRQPTTAVGRQTHHLQGVGERELDLDRKLRVMPGAGGMATPSWSGPARAPSGRQPERGAQGGQYSPLPGCVQGRSRAGRLRSRAACRSASPFAGPP